MEWLFASVRNSLAPQCVLARRRLFVFVVAKNTGSTGPRAVRRRCDFWYPSMSAGAAPSSGQARSTRKADFEFQQWPRRIKVGGRTPNDAWIEDGLRPNERVIVYPSDSVAEGKQLKTVRGPA
jgi:hypothetical protein